MIHQRGRHLLLIAALSVSPWSAASEVSPSRIQLMSARALAFLKKSQRIDGSYAGSRYQVACHALSGLAFLSCGYTPKHGEHAVKLRLGLRRLLSYQDGNGFFDDKASMMYGHGFATLYLAQVLGMWGVPSEERKLQDALRRAIRLIESAQDARGGWDYLPKGRGGSDCSITVCQTMALRAARNIGLAVDKKVIDRALDYIRKAQAASGGFYYRTDPAGHFLGNKVSLGCSAAGVCILNGLGEYHSKRVARGLDYLKKEYQKVPEVACFFYYTHYYASQAIYRSGGPFWTDYYGYITKALMKRQDADGAWRFDNRFALVLKVGAEEPVIATSMAAFVLNVPKALLPIIEK